MENENKRMETNETTTECKSENENGKTKYNNYNSTMKMILLTVKIQSV